MAHCRVSNYSELFRLNSDFQSEYLSPSFRKEKDLVKVSCSSAFAFSHEKE